MLLKYQLQHQRDVEERRRKVRAAEMADEARLSG